MVNWDADDIQEFKKQARSKQQEYCDLLGDREWDAIDHWEWTILRQKVGFGIFGPPGATPDTDNKHTGYNKSQLDIIEKVCDQLVENLNFRNRTIHFACIFVVVKVFEKSYTVPVFKAKKDEDSSSKCVYVDTGARKYSDWSDYLDKNTLEKCIYCYPAEGLYETSQQNEVLVKFGTSPACDLVNRIFSIFDTVSTVVAITATGVGVAALLTVPIAGPVLAATAAASVSTGAYGVTRSSYALYDRATHSQSIALTDTEARGCWLAIVGSSLGFAQGRMIASMTTAARAGEVMGTAGRIAFMVVQTGNLTVNGIGIIHGLAVLIDKTERNQLTALDVFQFSASLLFFTNAVVNVKTAGSIIKEVQHDVINSHREGLSKEARKVFNKQTGKLRGPDEMHGNAKVVKQLNRLGNSQDFYEMLADKNVASHKVKLTPDGYKGLLEVNKNLKIHPLKLLEIPKESRQAIFNSTRNFADGNISKDQFHKEMKTYCRTHQINFETMRQETVQRLCQTFGTENIKDITVGGKKIFANATPHEIDRLRVVLENTTQNDANIMNIATEFAAMRECNSTRDFIIFAEYFVADLQETVKSYEANYQTSLANAKREPGFKQAKFDESYMGKTGVKRAQFHKQKALEQYLSDEGFANLNDRFNNLKDTVGPLNSACQPGFFTDGAATYHYLKHKHFGSAGELTPEQYFQIAEEVVGNPTNRTNSMLSQDGSCVMITYLEPERGVKAVKIDRQGGSGIATVMYDDRVYRSRNA